ncbi:hypothetical protein ACV1DG_24030 [Aeromonas hydrophila]|nr:hypothetical protein [Klebsiella pneumoniae]HCG2948058.1 hypothetical protein [Klebsiella pneumoniae]
MAIELTADALHELRWLATEKATSGKWVMDGQGAIIAADDQLNGGFVVAQSQGPDADWNVRFITAVSPEVVSHLVDRLVRLERLAEAAKFLVKAEADGSPTGAFGDAIDWVIKEAKGLG